MNPLYFKASRFPCNRLLHPRYQCLTLQTCWAWLLHTLTLHHLLRIFEERIWNGLLLKGTKLMAPCSAFLAPSIVADRFRNRRGRWRSTWTGITMINRVPSTCIFIKMNGASMFQEHSGVSQQDPSALTNWQLKKHTTSTGNGLVQRLRHTLFLICQQNPSVSNVQHSRNALLQYPSKYNSNVKQR